MKKQTEKSIIAYKVFDPDWKCRGFQYEVGKSYSIKEEPIMCEKGFHACKKVQDCFSYYSFDPLNRVAEVTLSGIILGEDGDKQCSQRITINKELSWNEMLSLANTGSGNTGHSNSGYRNSGNSNSGYRNSGDSNSGDSNSGDSNSGDRNSGNSNSGYRNSGDSNSGYRNSGDSNSGDSNSGDRNSGDFNSTTPESANFFNKPCKLSVWDKAPKPDFIYNVVLNKWIDWSVMTDREKIDNKNAFVCQGYLKTFKYKEAWAEAFKTATKEDIKLLKALPNFNSDVFFTITGIKIK